MRIRSPERGDALIVVDVQKDFLRAPWKGAPS